jgi:hypothetical protein
MQRQVRVRSAVWTAAVTLVLLGAAAPGALAQPGQPSVVVNPDQSVVVSYAPVTPVPAGGAWIEAAYNGVPIPGMPFFIGTATTVVSPPLPAGSYLIRIVYATGEASPVLAFSIGLLGAPTIRVAAADLDSVVLAWDPPASGPITHYELEVTLPRTGQVVVFPVGAAPGATFRNVPPGLYRVRVRAVNTLGPGPYSAPSGDIQVGTVVAGGDLQIALTWNSAVDMDLHVREPDGGHVYWNRLVGRSARLDFDDVDGFGPENIIVAPGLALPGFYSVFIVHNSRDLETTSTIAITLGAASSNPSTSIFTRRTRRAAPGTAVLVATINVLTGEIVEALGTAPATADTLESTAKAVAK